MKKDAALSSMVSEIKRGSGKRWLFTVTVVILLAGLIAVVVVGFRGRRIQQNAEAISVPVAKSP